MEGIIMPTATQQQTVRVLIKRGREISGILHIAHKAMRFLSREERIQVTGKFPDKRPFPAKIMGGGDEYEDLNESLGEVTSLIRTIAGWLENRKNGEILEVTISAI